MGGHLRLPEWVQEECFGAVAGEEPEKEEGLEGEEGFGVAEVEESFGLSVAVAVAVAHY